LTNVIHKFLIYYIYLFTSALHVSGFLVEADIQLWQWFKSAGYGVSSHNQRNAQVFNLFFYLFTSALHVSGFLVTHLQRKLYNFGSGSSILGMGYAPGRGPQTQET
jgi:cytochrome b561